ncbi:MAG: hypothetical protein JO301_16980 [Chitinophagaceae bacterium]|nr:hypothetical protein [Chitinophagaceae bacterium]
MKTRSIYLKPVQKETLKLSLLGSDIKNGGLATAIAKHAGDVADDDRVIVGVVLTVLNVGRSKTVEEEI